MILDFKFKPRAFTISEQMAEEMRKKKPRIPLSDREIGRRVDPLVGLMAEGEIDLNDVGESAVAAALENKWREMNGK